MIGTLSVPKNLVFPVRRQEAKLEIRQSANGSFYWRFRIGGSLLNLSANHFHTSGEAEANARRVLGPGWQADGIRTVYPAERTGPGGAPLKSESDPFGGGEGPLTVLGFCRRRPWWQRLRIWFEGWRG